MVAFGAVLRGLGGHAHLAIQRTYRPARCSTNTRSSTRSSAASSVLEGFIILIAILLILDPHYTLPDVKQAVGAGEFTFLRSLHELLDDTLIADILRHSVIPAILAVIGFLLPQDVRDAFARAGGALVARR